MKRLRRRTAAIALASLALGIFAPTTPAVAGTGSADPSLLSRFFPTHGQVELNTDKYSSYVYQWIYWQSAARIAHLRDSGGDAFEQEVMLFTGSGCWGWAYDRGSWDSDYPYAYLDVDGDDDVRTNRAGGSGKSKFFGTGRYYYHWLRVKGKCHNDTAPYVLKAQDSHRSGPCSAGWAWCVFADSGSPRDIIPYNKGYKAGNTYNWMYEQLYNDGFEDGLAGWHLRGGDPQHYTPKWGTYASFGALDRSRYLSFHCNGGPGCWIYQLVPHAVTHEDIWTGEVGLRCRPSNPSATSCLVTMGLSAIGGNPDEHVSKTFNVPNDGKWHVYGYRGSQYASHNKMRFLLTNDSTRNRIDVDLATLHYSDKWF